MSLYLEIDKCRACGSSDIPTVLDLGMFAISDFLDSPDAFTDRAPLELVRCEGCTLVQLRHTVDRDRLYKRYWYRSATQPTMVSALQDVVRDATARVALDEGDAVIDIGANDGTLLRMYPKGVRRIAYEPAENLWPALQGRSWDSAVDIVSVHGYFPQMVGDQLVGMEPGAKIITSCACFYDVNDPNQFVEGIKKSLHPEGVWINQMAYLPATLEIGNFGDFCHEHLTYWTADAFYRLLQRHDLSVEEFALNDVNGGSIRFTVRHGEIVPLNLPLPHVWDVFEERIMRQRHEVIRTIQQLLGQGKTIVGYGASTKGNTYLQYWGISPRWVPFIADRNPDKFGKYTPTGQRVISEAEMRAMKPDYLLVLPFHFLEAFKERESALLASGTKMIVPFPQLHFVGGEPVAHVQPEATVPDDRAPVRP